MAPMRAAHLVAAGLASQPSHPLGNSDSMNMVHAVLLKTPVLYEYLN